MNKHLMIGAAAAAALFLYARHASAATGDTELNDASPWGSVGTAGASPGSTFAGTTPTTHVPVLSAGRAPQQPMPAPLTTPAVNVTPSSSAVTTAAATTAGGFRENVDIQESWVPRINAAFASGGVAGLDAALKSYGVENLNAGEARSIWHLNDQQVVDLQQGGVLWGDLRPYLQ